MRIRVSLDIRAHSLLEGVSRRKEMDASRVERVCSAAWRKFYGQATKGARWMPWQKQAMKDVASCEKLRGAAHRL